MVQVAWASGTTEKQAGKGHVLLFEGDLTMLGTDAVVYYAREDLVLGSGYGTAIQSRGGDAIRKELAAIGGFYGVPLALCAAVMLDSIRAALASATALRQVAICVTDSREVAFFRREMEKL